MICWLRLEQLALSRRCGFASGLEEKLLSEGGQWRKLDLMMQMAAPIRG